MPAINKIITAPETKGKQPTKKIETSKVLRAIIKVSWKFFGWKIEINSPPIIAPAPSSEVKNPARYGLTSKRSKKITAISAKYGNANILKMGVRHKTRMIDCFCLA